MTAGELGLVIAAVLCVIGFAALTVALVRVLDALKMLRTDIAQLHQRTQLMLDELRDATDEARDSAQQARDDLERFDRVLGSAEAIGDAVSNTVARTAFSSPAIKAVGLAKGTSRAWRRLRRDVPPDSLLGPPRTVIASAGDVDMSASGSGFAAVRRLDNARRRGADGSVVDDTTRDVGEMRKRRRR